MGRRKLGSLNVVALVLGLAFLYLPILWLVVYSFNASKLVSVWGGFSVEWYGKLLENQTLLNSAWVTLRVAVVSAILATFLGTLTALALSRKNSFAGKTLLSGMIFAPMVMPEVITGLALLLLFVARDIDRNIWTIIIAHTTLTMCYVTVVVQSRLVTMDQSLVEAAMDLGATPFKTFFLVTLPLIFPSIGAGFLLAFTLSLDDVVLASFTSGSGASTLPVTIFSQVRKGVTPEINAASTILIALVTIGVITATLAAKRRAAKMAVLSSS